MGFELSFNSLSSLNGIDEDDASDLKELLQKRGISFVDLEDSEPWVGDFYDGDAEEDEEGGFAVHVSGPELAWSDWSNVQQLLVETLGEKAVPTALHIHAWYGVAVPGDIENTYLRDPLPRQIAKPKLGFLQKLGFLKPKVDPVQAQVDSMVSSYGGGTDSLVIVSAPRLLAEMEAAIEKLGIANRDYMGIYQNSEDLDTPEMASVALQIFHKVLKDGYAHKYLVWWMK